MNLEKKLNDYTNVKKQISEIHERNKETFYRMGETRFYIPVYINYKEDGCNKVNGNVNVKVHLAMIHDNTGEIFDEVRKINRKLFVCNVMATTPKEAFIKALKLIIDEFTEQRELVYTSLLKRIELITEKEMITFLEDEVKETQKQIEREREWKQQYISFG